MAQKVIKVGSSAAVVIPKKSLESLGITVGSKVHVSVDVRQKRMFVDPTQEISPLENKETVAWTKKFISRYRKALEELAQK